MALLLAGVESGDDVGMDDLGGGLDLTLETERRHDRIAAAGEPAP